MATSPFPGMDPFLEQDWLDVHAALITYMRDQLQVQLPQDLCARMESRVLVEDDFGDEQGERHPDVRVVEVQGSQGATAVLDLPRLNSIEPDVVLVQVRSEPATQRYIEIVDSQTRSRVITTIELISPTNKRAGIGNNLYLAKREECLDAGVNFVEIDLTRGGDRSAILPELEKLRPPPMYVGCVRRGARPIEMALYLMPLDQPLKPMRIPLRPKDEDVVLHLQPLVATAYDRGRYDTLDYRRPLDPPLAGVEAEYVQTMLKAAGRI